MSRLPHSGIKSRPKRRRGRKALRRRARRGNQSSGALSKVKHYARISETVLFTPMAPNQDYNYAFSLSLFERALAVSRNFKFYRPKRVVWTYLPDFNTFQSGGTVTLPQVSMIMNRTGDSSAWTPNEYEAQGAVPKQFSKKMVIAYRPNIVQSVQFVTTAIPAFGGNIGVRPVYNEWIATGTYNSVFPLPLPPGGIATVLKPNNELLYQGHSMYWNVATPGAVTVLGTVYCEVEWEFKDPLFQDAPGTALQSVPVTSP